MMGIRTDKRSKKMMETNHYGKKQGDAILRK